MLPYLLIVVAFLLILVLIIYLYLTWHYDYWQRQNVTGPKPVILSGTFPKTYASKCNFVEEMHEIYLKYKDKQSCVGIFMARSPKLFVLDANLVSYILTKNFKHFRDNESSQWTSPQVEQLRFASPFVSVGEAWKEKRSELVQSLTINRLRSCFGSMKAGAQKMVKFINAHDPATIWDAKELAQRFTSHIMANFIWGIEENTFEDLAKHSTIHDMAETMLNQALRCVRYYGRTAAWPWLRKLHPIRFFPAVSDEFFKRLFTDAIRQRQDSGITTNDVINHLMQLREKKSLDDIEFAGHTTTVLIDGFETAAMVIAHTLLMLSRNTRVQNKLRDILKQSEEICSYDELMSVEYLDQCIQETLRLFPPLATFSKICTESILLDNELNNSKVHVKLGDVVYVSAYSFHRNPEFFENPEEFWPERFDEEFGGIKKFRDMGVFLPFGDGPRMCPGMKLGMLEVKVAIAELIQSFEFIRAGNTRKDNKVAADTFLLKLDGNIQLHVKRL